MTAFGAWFRARWRGLRHIVLGVSTWPLALWAGLAAWPPVPPLDATGRLHLALQLAVAPAVVLLLMVVACFRLFDTLGAANPLAGKESRRFQVNARVLQNTLEQAAIFVPILLALSLRLAPDDVKVLPVLTALWCVGRLAFWVGYHIEVMARGLGFDWTILTTTLGLGWFVATLL